MIFIFQRADERFKRIIDYALIFRMNMFPFAFVFFVIARDRNGCISSSSTLSYDDVVSLANLYRQDRDQYRQERHRAVEESELRGRALDLNYCLGTVRNGMKIIQLKCTSPQYITKFPELKDLRNQEVLQEIQSQEVGSGMSPEHASDFVTKLKSVLDYLKLGTLWCSMVMKFEPEIISPSYSIVSMCEKEPKMAVGRVLKSLTFNEVNLKPDVMGFILTSIDGSMLGRLLTLLKDTLVWNVVKNTKLPDGCTWDKLFEKIESSHMDKIYAKFRLTQKQQIRILLEWLITSEEVKDIRDEKLNGRIKYFAEKLKAEFPEVKTKHDANGLADGIVKTFSIICSRKGKKGQRDMKADDAKKMQHFIDTIQVFFDADEDAKKCKNLLNDVCSGEYEITDDEAKILERGKWW